LPRVHPQLGGIHHIGKTAGLHCRYLSPMFSNAPPPPVPADRAETGVGGAGRPARPDARPDFFIVGAPKCGTTAMSDYLARHPEIFMARKEMHFFGSDLRFADHFFRRGKQEYLAEFAGRSGHRSTGEASVWYLMSERAAEEIEAFSPGARIIIMLREPAEMLYSLFRYFQYDGNEPLGDFGAALAAEPERKAGRGLGRQTYLAQGLLYHETARFARQVRRYFQVFGRERVRVILHEDLTADPAAAYRATLEFLEVDPGFSLPRFERVNPAQSVKSRALRAVLNDPWPRSVALAARPWVPNALFNGFHRIERRLQGLNSSAAGPAPLAPEMAARLRGEYADEVEELGELIGRDLSHWTCGTRA
jgi:hypothetical protein